MWEPVSVSVTSKIINIIINQIHNKKQPLRDKISNYLTFLELKVIQISGLFSLKKYLFLNSVAYIL